MARWILLLAFSVALQAQTHAGISTRTGVTADKATLAHNPAAPIGIQACLAVVTATVSGTATVQVGGTAATATVVAPVPISPGGKAARAKFYSNSDVGSGTAVSGAMNFAANTPYLINMKGIWLSGYGTTKNTTLVIALDASGNVTTTIYWAEDGKCEN